MKFLKLIAIVICTGNLFAQDTLCSHFTPSSSPVLIQLGPSLGLLSGHNNFAYNNYGHKFDNTYGVTSSMDSITSVLLNFARNTGVNTAIVKVYDDNAGETGNVIGQTTINGSNISSTSLGSLGLNKDYNATASFSPAISIPSNGIFYMLLEITYPTNGDTLALWTTPIGDFADAGTHAFFYQPSQSTWRNITYLSSVQVAFAIFPVIDENKGTPVGIQNLETNNSPTIINTDNLLLITDLAEQEVSTINVYDVTGKVISSSNTTSKHKTIPTADLKSGIYIVDISTNTSRFTQKLMIK